MNNLLYAINQPRAWIRSDKMQYYVDIVEIATGRIDKSIPCANERKQMNMYAMMSTRINDRYEVVFRDEAQPNSEA